MSTVCLTGGRSYGDDEVVHDTLEDLLRQYPDMEVGVYRADWRRYGDAAGPIRNERMLREEDPLLLVAFPGGPGTADCCLAAAQMGIRTTRAGALQRDTLRLL